MSVKPTRVIRDVFPDPLGPISRIDGKAVKLLELKIKKCKKSGIVRTRTTAMPSPSGDGLRRACTKFAIVAMLGAGI